MNVIARLEFELAAAQHFNHYATSTPPIFSMMMMMMMMMMMRERELRESLQSICFEDDDDGLLSKVGITSSLICGSILKRI